MDVLILSIGGNDVGFSDIVRACARLVGSCAGEAIPEASPVAQARAKLLRFGLQYVRLYRAIDAKLNVANVLLSEYADAWIDDAGDYCVIRGLPLGATIRRDDVRWLQAWLLRCRLLDRPVRGLLGTAGGRPRDPAPEPGRT